MTAFDETRDALRRQRAQTLDLLAQHGEAGRQMVQQSQAANAQHGRDVIGAALDQSRTLGAPDAMQDQSRSTVGDANSILRAAAESSQGSLQRDLRRQRQGAFDYSLSAQRAVPVIQAAADRDIGNARTQFQQDEWRQAEQQNWAREQQQWRREEHEAALRQQNQLSSAEIALRAQGEQQQNADQQMVQAIADAQNRAAWFEALARNQQGLTANDFGGPQARTTLSANAAEHLATNAPNVGTSQIGPVIRQTGKTMTSFKPATQQSLGLADNAGLISTRPQQHSAEQAIADLLSDWQGYQSSPLVQQRNAAIRLGMPMLEAYGRYVPEEHSPADKLSDARAQAELSFLDEYGITNPTTEQLTAYERGEDPFAPKPYDLSAGVKQLDLEPQRVLDVMSSRPYADAIDTIGDLISQGAAPMRALAEASERLTHAAASGAYGDKDHDEKLVEDIINLLTIHFTAG